MATLEILNPVAEIRRGKVEPARRLDTLEGKTIGLYWNQKPGGDIALGHMASELSKRFGGLAFRNYLGSVGSPSRQATPEDVARIAREVDAVIGTNAD